MKKEHTTLYLLAFVKLVFPFFLQNPIYEPHRDEFLYLAEGHHLAWGFMEIPPLLSVFAWLSDSLGTSIFWIKFWPSLFGALTFIIVGKIILSLGGRILALFLGFLPFIFGAYLRVNFLFQPNFLEIFFWTIIGFSVIRFIQTQKNGWLYVFGISAGLGMNSKYSVAFFLISIVAGLLITRKRKIFSNKHLYIGAFLGFLIFLPNILWQYDHHFPVFAHMKELHDTQLQYVKPADFLIGQLLMNLPCVFIWIAGLYFVLVKQNRKYLTFAWSYLLVILLLLYFQGKNYYALGVYPVLFAFGAYHLEQFALQHSKVWKYAFIAIPLIIGLPLIPLSLPVSPPSKLAKYYQKRWVEKAGVLKWEDHKNHSLPQDFADMLAWKEMTAKTAKAFHSLTSEEQQHAVIFCDNYGQAGAVNLYRKEYHLPEALSDNASFLYWLPDSLHLDNIILVTDDQKEMEHDFIKYFSSAVVSDSITNPFAREHGTLILTLKGANEAVNQMFQQKIKKDKERFE